MYIYCNKRIVYLLIHRNARITCNTLESLLNRRRQYNRTETISALILFRRTATEGGLVFSASNHRRLVRVANIIARAK